MATPSQDLIRCKQCGVYGEPHKQHRLFCRPCASAKNVAYQRAYRARLRATPRNVVCKGCGETFSTEKSGRTWRCQPCTTAYQAALVKRDRERHAAYSRRYRASLGNEYRERMVKRRSAMLEAMTTEERVAFRRREADKTNRLNKKLRGEVFAAYGGEVCRCCGETEPMFLSIDHVSNDGAEMRAAGTHGRGGSQFYQWLRKNGFPPGFQVLCLNCNIGKHRNGGVCPHRSGKV